MRARMTRVLPVPGGASSSTASLEVRIASACTRLGSILSDDDIEAALWARWRATASGGGERLVVDGCGTRSVGAKRQFPSGQLNSTYVYSCTYTSQRVVLLFELA